jgi:hypothetical protein
MKQNKPGSKEHKLPRHIEEALDDSYEPIRAWDPPKFDALVQENIEFMLEEIPEHTKDGCPVDFILSGAYEAELNRLMKKKWKEHSKTLFEGAAMLVAMQEVYKQRN